MAIQRVKWTRADEIAALALYCQIPFGKMHAGNPLVKALAQRQGRSPSSISLKLVNYASLDPEHRRRGIKGMTNTSELSREIWAEFYGKWDTLAEYAEATTDSEQPERTVPRESDFITTIRARRGQQFFRRVVLAAYANCCCITGINCRDLLRASHIIPWAQRQDTRLDPRNGLAMNALHDAAFDRGLITFDQDRRLLVSRKLRKAIPPLEYDRFFDRYAGQPLREPDRFAPADDMLQYHYSHVFQN